MVSGELLELATRGDRKRGLTEAWLPDQDAHVNALVGVLRQLADGGKLRHVLGRAVELGLRTDAFPDLLDVIDPPPRPPAMMIDNAVRAAWALVQVADQAAADARGMIDVYRRRE